MQTYLRYFFIIILMGWQVVYAEPFTLSVEQIEVSELIHLLADVLHKNILISENVRGKISLNVDQVPAQTR